MPLCRDRERGIVASFRSVACHRFVSRSCCSGCRVRRVASRLRIPCRECIVCRAVRAQSANYAQVAHACSAHATSTTRGVQAHRPLLFDPRDLRTHSRALLLACACALTQRQSCDARASARWAASDSSAHRQRRSCTKPDPTVACHLASEDCALGLK